MTDDTKAVGPSIPFRPLPKISPRIPVRIASPKVHVGTKIHVRICPKSIYEKPFWRVFEVTHIDGDTCRLVTTDKRIAMNEKLQVVEKLAEVETIS